MGDNVYKKIEIIGTSKKSSDDAVANALARASKSIKHMRWFEVVEKRGSIEKGAIDQWQVTIKIGFTMDE